MNSTDLTIELNGKVTSVLNSTLRQSVTDALEKYMLHLDGQSPINLYQMVLMQVEAPLFEFVMALTNSNQSQAAVLLGLSRGTLRKKLKQYNIND